MNGPAIGAWTKKLEAPDFLAVITPYSIPGWLKKPMCCCPAHCGAKKTELIAAWKARTVFKLRVLDPPQGGRCTWDILQILALRAGARMYAQTWEAIRNESGRTAGDPLDSITR